MFRTVLPPALPRHPQGDTAAREAQSRRTPPRARCGVWVAQGGAAGVAKQSPRAKIEQRRADRPPLAEIPTVERPRPVPPHRATVAREAQSRHTPPRARCGVWVERGGAAGVAKQSPHAKIEQRRADRPPLTETPLLVERGDLGRFGDTSKNARCAVWAMSYSPRRTHASCPMTRIVQRLHADRGRHRPTLQNLVKM